MLALLRCLATLGAASAVAERTATNTDVLVYGATPGGVAAAIAAYRALGGRGRSASVTI